MGQEVIQENGVKISIDYADKIDKLSGGSHIELDMYNSSNNPKKVTLRVEMDVEYHDGRGTKSHESEWTWMLSPQEAVSNMISLGAAVLGNVRNIALSDGTFRIETM